LHLSTHCTLKHIDGTSLKIFQIQPFVRQYAQKNAVKHDKAHKYFRKFKEIMTKTLNWYKLHHRVACM